MMGTAPDNSTSTTNVPKGAFAHPTRLMRFDAVRCGSFLTGILPIGPSAHPQNFLRACVSSSAEEWQNKPGVMDGVRHRPRAAGPAKPFPRSPAAAPPPGRKRGKANEPTR
uniref:Uncharacterized protein n=1 Tax=Candidatus Kentrum sp. DK TaxID=2126562 RepID=A0A450SAH6_9GAMM|nr:MAG: hypothetical protein BECKDK2373B_GA0170837_102251 [Candidatus Kentron sp. DK]